jgi:hypothetical protein
VRQAILAQVGLAFIQKIEYVDQEAGIDLAQCGWLARGATILQEQSDGEKAHHHHGQH